MSDSAEQLYERVLVVRCQAGDAEAFAELMASYGSRLRYFLRKLLGGERDAEDVLQDVWFDVFRSVPKLTEPAAFPAWVYRVARDRAYRLLRRSHRTTHTLDGHELPDDDTARNGTFNADDVEQIHKALDGLALEHREVLVLRFLEGMSYEDVARVIGCPLGTVRSRIHYAKHALRRALETEDER